VLFYRGTSAPSAVGHFAIPKKYPPIPRRIIGIVCQTGHISRDWWCKVAHRVSEPDDFEIMGGCNVWIRTGRDHNYYLFGSLATSKSISAQCWWGLKIANDYATYRSKRTGHRLEHIDRRACSGAVWPSRASLSRRQRPDSISVQSPVSAPARQQYKFNRSRLPASLYGSPLPNAVYR